MNTTFLGVRMDMVHGLRFVRHAETASFTRPAEFVPWHGVPRALSMGPAADHGVDYVRFQRITPVYGN